MALILNLNRSQTDRIGNTQLEVIRSELEDTITAAEGNVLRVSMGAEQMLDRQAPGRSCPPSLTPSAPASSTRRTL